MSVAIVTGRMEPLSPETEPSPSGSESISGRLPLRTTAVMAGLTVAVLALVAGHTWLTFQAHREEYERSDRLRQRAVALLSDGQAVTVLARAAAETGHPGTEQRYRAAAASFEEALRELRTLATIGDMGQVAFRMERLNADLTATALRALDLRREGQSAEAVATLSSDAYRATVNAFDAENKAIIDELDRRGAAHLDSERRRTVLVLVLSGLAVPVLVVIWVAVLARTRTYLRRHRQLQQALRESEQRYRTLFESNPFPMLVYDPQTLAILGANGAAVERYEYTRQEFLGMTLRDLRVPADLQALHEQVEKLRSTGESELHTSRHRTKDGAILEVEVTSRAVEFAGRRVRLATMHDVTERKLLEEQFRQAQKMDAVGRLAGGVAHDFNNVLNVILGYAELTMRTMDESDRRRRNLTEIRKAGDHAASLTRQLLAFARGQVLQPRVLDLNAVVGEMERMVRRMIGEDLDLVTSLGADLGRVKADPSQIGQVILNLAVNARDAMPSGGKLTIETADAELDGRAQPGLPPGRYVMLAVTDTGCGMPKSVQDHIFEPFFTTKEKDKGTGLGLATVYGIVKQSGGSIAVHSEVGRGSTFKIYLPRVEAPAEVVASNPMVAEAPRGSETVLLVEDDPAVRGLTSAVLSDSGYHVLEAPGGHEAIALVEGYPSHIHLLLTDVVMPGMNGRELARRLQEMRPGLPTLYMSGYAPGAIVHQGVLDPGLAFIAKPMRPLDLTRKVREVLDAQPTAPSASDPPPPVRAREAGSL
jgi:two-component system cell cycle sensor histidine kinase/response regulator CckA